MRQFFATLLSPSQDSAPTYISRDLAQCGMELLHSCWSERQPVRALTITAQNLVEERDAGEQVDLFAADAIPCRDKLEKLEKAMDSIRDKYGRGAISIASAVHPVGEPDREDQRLPPGD